MKELTPDFVGLLAQDLAGVSEVDELMKKLGLWAEEVAVGRPWAVWLEGFPTEPNATPVVLVWKTDGGGPADWKNVREHSRKCGINSSEVVTATTIGVPRAEPDENCIVLSVGWPTAGPDAAGGADAEEGKGPGGKRGEEESPRLALGVILPGSGRRGLAVTVRELLGQTLARVALRQAEQIGPLRIDERYSKRAFEKMVTRAAPFARMLALLDPERFTAFLESLTLHFDSYVRETFGDAADDGFLDQLRKSLNRPEEPPAPVQRTLEVWAALLHLRALLIRTEVRISKDSPRWLSAMPPPLGALLPLDARPWRDLLGELLLFHWIGSFEAARIAFTHPCLHRGLWELGWWGGGRRPDAMRRKSFAGSLLKTLASAAVERFCRPEASGTTGHVIGRLLKPKGHLISGSQQELSFFLSRWMILQQLVELRLVEIDRRTLEAQDSLLRLAMDTLWEETEKLCFRWMLAHRQWSTPGGVRGDAADSARNVIDSWLGDSHEDTSEKSNPIGLHIDSVWTNLYLLHRIFRHFRPDPGKGARWSRLVEELPTEAVLRRFLRHMSRMTVFILWQLLQNERYPERYAIVPAPHRVGNGEENADERISDGLPPYHQPVGAERYSRSLVYLMDIFGHVVLHIEREVDISGYLSGVIESELLLHAVSDYYRDHLYHLVDMCLFGDFLLTSRRSRRRGHLFRLLMPPPEDAAGGGLLGLDDVRRQWFIAAVFHDVGYLFSLMVRLPKLLRGHRAEAHHDFIEALDEALHGQVKLLEERITDLTEHMGTESPGLDRGVQSALILRDHLERAGRCGGGKPLVVRYAPSLRAICQHNLMTEEVRQDRDPLSYLLVLCDELQDWGRNRVQARELRRYTVFRTAGDANWQERRIPILTELFVPIEGLEGDDFVLILDEDNQMAGAQPFHRGRGPTLRIVQSYAQDEVGYLNPIYLWVLRSENLQRLVPSVREDRRLNVEVVTVTGVPQRLRKVDSTFSGIFQEIAVRNHGLRLGDLLRHFQRPFREIMEKTDRGLAHDFAMRINQEMEQSDRTVEMQILSLRDLSAEKPLRGFSRTRDLEELAGAYHQIIREREERRRLRGLHPLRSGKVLATAHTPPRPRTVTKGVRKRIRTKGNVG